jgi:protein required for attachment to host cells
LIRKRQAAKIITENKPKWVPEMLSICARPVTLNTFLRSWLTEEVSPVVTAEMSAAGSSLNLPAT